MWIIVAIVLVGIMFLPKPSPHVGDATKLERTFTATERETIAGRKISADELAAANCEDGAACWVLVDGVVYDMSVFPAWARGQHHGVKAGTDGTDKFLKSGHGVAVLQKMPVVGGC